MPKEAASGLLFLCPQFGAVLLSLSGLPAAAGCEVIRIFQQHRL
jgi:hypothetical protein